MKRARFLPLFLVLVMALTLVASAATPRYNVTNKCSPNLRIIGTTANCEASIVADSGAKISGTLTLYRVSSSKVEVASWPISGTTSLNIANTIGVTRGQSYQLILDVTISAPDGTDYITKSVSATCT